MGYLAAIGAAVIWATYSVASRLVKQVPTDAVGWFCGVTALLGWVCHFLWEPTVWPSTTVQWLSVLGAGLGPVGIAFFTWDYGVKHGNLPLLGVLSYFTPLISTLLLIVFGRADFTWQVGVACIAIIVGALLASYKKR
jgi:drug/metabolite transporter (DMT)-like permease